MEQIKNDQLKLEEKRGRRRRRSKRRTKRGETTAAPGGAVKAEGPQSAKPVERAPRDEEKNIDPSQCQREGEPNQKHGKEIEKYREVLQL